MELISKQEVIAIIDKLILENSDTTRFEDGFDRGLIKLERELNKLEIRSHS